MMDVSNRDGYISHAVPEFIGFVVFFAIISIMVCISLALGLTRKWSLPYLDGDNYVCNSRISRLGKWG